MRIIIITGKGGVGKTSIAAATALKASKQGLKTLVMSTDQAHSLGDSYDINLGYEATKITENLYAQEVNVRKELLKNWENIKEFISNTIQSRGIDAIIAEELSIFPGMEELFSLLLLKELYNEKAYDLIIMDCAPTASTIRQLSFPEIGSWYLNKIFPIQRNMVKVARPIANKLYDVELPGEGVFDNIQNIILSLNGMKEILSDPSITSIRFVVNLEKMVIKEAQRAYTYMNLFGYNIDSVFINKIIPEEVQDDYLSKWKKIQKGYMETVEGAFSPIKIFKANLFDQELVGLDLLGRFGQHLYGDYIDPSEVFSDSKPMQIISNNGDYILNWRIPSVKREDLDLFIKGEELILQTPQFHRNMILPNVLLGKEIKEARFKENYLSIIFQKE